MSRDAEEFLSYLAVERGRAPASISAYRRDIAAYERFLSDQGVSLAGVDVGLVESYVALLGSFAATDLDGAGTGGCARPSSLLR